jgi:endonuclease/exonuclease/phosphatase (EEP) superfamily protein YafD
MIDWNGRALGIAVTHLAWPFMEPADATLLATATPAAPTLQFPDVPRLSQSFQAANLAAHIAGMPDDLILIGDFNSASWSAAQKAFRGATRLDNQGRLLRTWPTWAWSILRLPIDHVFVRGKPQVTKIGLGPNVGSDHLPVEAEITMAP